MRLSLICIGQAGRLSPGSQSGRSLPDDVPYTEENDSCDKSNQGSEDQQIFSSMLCVQVSPALPSVCFLVPPVAICHNRSQLLFPIEDGCGAEIACRR